MLSGQGGRNVTTILLLNPSELASSGYIKSVEGMPLQKVNEKVNDPDAPDAPRLKMHIPWVKLSSLVFCLKHVIRKAREEAYDI